MATVGKLQVDIGINLKELQKGLKQAKKLLQQFERQTYQVRLTVDTSSLQSSLRTAQRQINSVAGSTQTVNIHANTSQASSQISSLQEQIESVKDIGSNLTMSVTLPATAIGISSVQSAIEQQQMQSKLQASFGTTTEEAKKLTNQAKQIWASGFGESMEETNQALTTTKQLMSDLSGAELSAVTKGALTIKDVFDKEVNESVKAGSIMMKNFGISAEDSMDLISVGFQRGGNYADDLLDTISEYSVQFANLGLSGKDFVNTLIQAKDAGAFNTDVIGDSYKEFLIEAEQNASRVAEGFKLLGFDAEDMASKIAGGGDEAKNAFSAMKIALSSIKDPLKQQQAGVAIYGSLWENAKDEVLLNIDLTKDAIGDVDGAMENLSKTMENKTLESFRSLALSFSELKKSIGETLLPILERVAEALKGVVDWFNNLSKPVKDFAVIAVLVVSVISPLILLFGGLLAVIPFVITGFGMLVSALSFLLSPIGLVIAGILLFVGYLVYLYNTNEEVASYINQIWQDYLVPLASFFKSIWELILTVVQTVLRLMGDLIMLFLSVLTGDWDKAWKYLVVLLTNASIGIVNTVITLAETIVNLFVSLANSVGRLVMNLVNGIIKGFNFLGNGLVAIMGSIGTAILGGFEGIMFGVDAFLNKTVKAYNAVAGVMGGKTISASFDLSGGIGDARSELWKNTKNVFKDSPDAFQFDTSGSLDSADFSKYKKDFISLNDSSSKSSKPAWELGSWANDFKSLLDFEIPSLEEIATDMEDISKTSKDAMNDANKAMDGIGKTASESSSEIDKMQSAIDSLASGLKSMSDSFNQSIGIFDRFSRKFTSMSTLLRNSKQRNLAYQEWYMLQEQLSSRSELSNESKYAVSQLDVNSLAELRALANSSSEELSSWSSYNTNVQRLSERQAVKSVAVENIYIDAKDKDYQTIADMLYKELKRKGAI